MMQSNKTHKVDFSCDIDQLGASQSPVSVALSLCYWRLNNPFCCIYLADILNPKIVPSHGQMPTPI